MRLNSTPLRIAARKSDLARLQAYAVGAALKKQFPKIKIEYSFRESLGDRNLVNPLWQMPEKGVFTEDFKDDLIQGRTDMVVHSWKDLPIEDNAQTAIFATLDRADSRDILLFKNQFLTKPPTDLKIMSSSPRREFNLKPFFAWSLPFAANDIQFQPVRGNIQTRIRKAIENPGVHGIIVAKAALDRLLSVKKKEFHATQLFLRRALKKMSMQVIPLSQSPTSAAQGALAIEILKSNTSVKRYLKEINNEQDFNLVNEERRLFKRWGGGCHQRMGVSLQSMGPHVLSFERGLDQHENFLWIQEILRTPLAKIKTILKSTDIVEVHQTLIKNISELKPYRAKKNDALIITKGNLLDPKSSKTVTLWSSGIETWRQLAAQGFWVTGTYDSLGEIVAPDVINVTKKPLKWKKLTHGHGHSKAWAKTLKLYRVDYKGIEDLKAHKSKSYFYWSHGDLFLLCLKKYPWLSKKKHICGLGSTLETILKHIKPKQIIPVYNFKEWKKKWIQ